jgi:hypothetical protein
LQFFKLYKVTTRKTITLISLLLVSAFIVYATLFKAVRHKEITINASVPVIHREISSLHSIARWYLPFASADSNKLNKQGRLGFENTVLILSRIVGYSAGYEVTENNKKANIFYDVMPDTAGYSKVILSYKNSLWDEAFNSGTIISNAKKSLESLKDYIGDAKKMYGYDIEMTRVTDTAFLFSSKIAASGDKKTALKNLYQSLIQFAEVKDLGYNGVRIFYSLPYGKDSVHLFTSIGITNTRNVPLTGPYILKRMPHMGHLLTAYYQGSFGNVVLSLDALSRFKSDHEMNSMAIPFVKLITEGIEFDDSQIIQANALYPVY